ncbi:hypothetical protein ILUMI_24442 [Ignelater luminosus]|uniref:Uncharacterized protein n=1 Tax=Ignelater luminosus TaxID=2038154 RepID=A0A8K0FWK9_IGNLU|nr:hypothetical protein ILUMI_24442 [Ignelater luminosus]
MTNGAEYKHSKKCDPTSTHGCTCDQPYVQQIRHQKCPVVKLVREQMGKVAGGCKQDSRCNSLWNRIWEKLFLGASLCGTSPYKRKLPGFGVPILAPTGTIGNAF